MSTSLKVLGEFSTRVLVDSSRKMFSQREFSFLILFAFMKCQKNFSTLQLERISRLHAENPHASLKLFFFEFSIELRASITN